MEWNNKGEEEEGEGAHEKGGRIWKKNVREKSDQYLVG